MNCVTAVAVSGARASGDTAELEGTSRKVRGLWGGIPAWLAVMWGQRV